MMGWIVSHCWSRGGGWREPAPSPPTARGLRARKKQQIFSLKEHKVQLLLFHKGSLRSGGEASPLSSTSPASPVDSAHKLSFQAGLAGTWGSGSQVQKPQRAVGADPKWKGSGALRDSLGQVDFSAAAQPRIGRSRPPRSTPACGSSFPHVAGSAWFPGQATLGPRLCLRTHPPARGVSRTSRPGHSGRST